MEPLLGTHRSGPQTVMFGRFLRWFPASLGLLLCQLMPLRFAAAELAAGGFQLEVVSAFERDAGWTTNWVWTVGTNRYWLAPIPHWNLRVNRSEQRLEMLNTNGTSAITLNHTVLTNQPTMDDLKAIAVERHQGFQVIAEDTLYSGCGSAAVFDLLLAEEGERVRPAMAAWRTALIVNEGGLLECTLRTSVRSQAGLLRTFGRFLVGLRPASPEDEETPP